jgi:hypothetical protein
MRPSPKTSSCLMRRNTSMWNSDTVLWEKGSLTYSTWIRNKPQKVWSRQQHELRYWGRHLGLRYPWFLLLKPTIIRVIKSRARRASHVALMGDRRGSYRTLVAKPQGKRHLEDIGLDGQLLLLIVMGNLHFSGKLVWQGLHGSKPPMHGTTIYLSSDTIHMGETLLTQLILKRQTTRWIHVPLQKLTVAHIID